MECSAKTAVADRASRAAVLDRPLACDLDAVALDAAQRGRDGIGRSDR